MAEITVRTTGDFMFHDLRSGQIAAPNQDNVMELTAVLEGAIHDGTLVEVKPKPEPAPKAAKAEK